MGGTAMSLELLLRRRAMMGGKKYFKFADPEVSRVVANKIGDSVGTTLEQIQSCTFMEGWFDGNTLIRTFDELEKFSSLRAIGNYTFRGCTNLTSTKLPQSLIRFYNDVFENTKIQSIVVPDSVTYMGIRVFSSCSSLKYAVIGRSVNGTMVGTFRYASKFETLVMLPLNPPGFNHVFYGASRIPYIYVQYSADHSILDAYKTAYGWSNYSDRMLELDENGNIPT